MTDWNEGDQDYRPNVVLRLNVWGGKTYSLTISWDKLVENNGQISIEESDPVTVSFCDYRCVDIPDTSNVVGEHKIVLRVHSDEDIYFMASVGDQ